MNYNLVNKQLKSIYTTKIELVLMEMYNSTYAVACEDKSTGKVRVVDNLTLSDAMSVFDSIFKEVEGYYGRFN